MSRWEVMFAISAGVIFVVLFAWIICAIIRELTGPVLPEDTDDS